MRKKSIPYLCITFILINFPAMGAEGKFVENLPAPVEIKSIDKILPGTMEILIPSSAQKNAQNIPVTIYTPPGKKILGNILVLPGWKHSRHRWLNETGIKAQADLHKFRLICPEMNITVYESQYFPETTLKWADTPGLRWIQKFLIPALKTKNIFLSNQNNFVLGLSTGARGAALITLDNPGLFNAAAALSGDFDQTKMPEDRLMTAVYGSIQLFPERWLKDNPAQSAKDWKTPLYLAHGTKDQVVPHSQTKLFYTILRDLHVALDIRLSMPEAGHDYAFWDSQIINVMDFFEKYIKRGR